ncbi:MAG: outer membrane protein CzcC [Nitrospirales bacterium]|nr:MAG: outer membrane protein CzcC [Nitrospirales bacterium]
MVVTKMLLMLLIMSGLQPVAAEDHVERASPNTATYTLQEILTIALERNPRIEEKHGIVEQQEGNTLTASSYSNPTISVQSGRGSLRDPSMKTTITERYITLSQPLEWPGTRLAQQQAAQARVKSAQAGLAEAKLNVTARTKTVFFDLLLSQHETVLIKENVQAMKRLNAAVRARVKAGESPPFEIVKMNVETLNMHKEWLRTKGAERSAKAILNSVTAGGLGKAFTIQGEFLSSAGNRDVTKFSEHTLSAHPKLVKRQERIKEAEQRHRQELHARVPNITLSGSYQRDVGREAFVGGISIPIPLWNQRQGEIAKAKGVMRQEEAIFLRTRTALHQRIIQEIQNSNIAAAQISTYEHGLLKQAQEALRIAQVSFQYGEASLLDVLDAQRVFRDTQLEYIRAKHELSVALTALEQFTGTLTQ